MKISQFTEDPLYFWKISIVAILDAYNGHHAYLHVTGLAALVPLFVVIKNSSNTRLLKVERYLYCGHQKQ